MFITTNKHAMDPRYRDSFRQPINMKDYFKGKPEELGKAITLAAIVETYALLGLLISFLAYNGVNVG